MPSHRRTIALIGALAVTAPLALLAPAAQAATSTDPAKVGMYGAPDRPFLEFDAVFVHSLAMLGLVASGGAPAPEAVTWLTTQQCPDGGFTAFRTPVGAPCPATDLGAFTGEDSNSTAVAAMALRAAGKTAEAQQAEAWLGGLRDGTDGWSYLLGSGSDPNSTALVLMALTTAGTAAAPPVDAYAASVAVGCVPPPADPADLGGITSPFSVGAPDLIATVQAVPGFGGAALPLGPTGTWSADAPALICPEAATPDAAQVADHAAAWLEAQQAAGAIDGANAGWAILGLRAVSAGRPEADLLYAALEPAALASANPGLVGLGALAAHALGETGDAPSYRAAIAALLTTAPASPAPTPTPAPTPAAPSAPTAPAAALPATLPDSGPPPAVLDMALVALGLLTLGGVLLAVGRRRRGSESSATPQASAPETPAPETPAARSPEPGSR